MRIIEEFVHHAREYHSVVDISRVDHERRDDGRSPEGAQQMLAQAIQEEVVGWIEGRAELRDVRGRHEVVRNGYLPRRAITTGIGLVNVSLVVAWLVVDATPLIAAAFLLSYLLSFAWAAIWWIKSIKAGAPS